MSKWKVTFEFESTTGNTGTAGSKAGWSESWYLNSDVARDVAQFNATVLAGFRRGVLTTGWQLNSIRLSQLDAAFNLTRKAFIIFVPPADAPGRYTGTNIDEQAYDALEISVGSAGGFSRRFQMRGIGNDVVSAGSRFLNPAQFSNKFFPFTNELTGQIFLQDTGPWAVRFRTIVAPADNPTGVSMVRSVSIGPVPASGTPQAPQLSVDGNTGLAAGQTVVIKDTLGMKRLNGSWKILRIDVPSGGAGPTTLTLAPKRRVTLSGTYNLSGTLRAYTYALDNIISVTPGYGTSRRTGRPLQSARGRRSNRTD